MWVRPVGLAAGSPSGDPATIRIVFDPASRSITQVAITGSAGAVDLVAAVSGLKIYVVQLVLGLDAAGTLKFTEGTGPTDLTGVIEVLADSPFVLGNGSGVVLQTNTAGVKLGVTTATGAPRGYLRYFVQ